MLKNKKILFFSPAFFGYENKIKDKMEELGASVDMFDERSIKKSYQKGLLKINPNIFNNLTEKYYFEILNNIKDNDYDYVFFVKCDMLTKKVLEVYKKTFINATFCLHLWDSLQNIPNIQGKFCYFDYVTSFDRKDCLNNKNIKFRPLFYCDEYKKKDKKDNYKYDLCFIGTIHSDRYKILKKIEVQAKKLGLKMYIYPFLQSKFIYYFYKLTKKEFKNTRIDDFEYGKISSYEITKKVDESRVVIDIQHPRQTGLTMRTIEMLGMEKKLITTNDDIINYDFYNSRNILVINRKKIDIDLNKLNDTYVSLSRELYYEYSLEKWVYDVLGGKKDE